MKPVQSVLLMTDTVSSALYRLQKKRLDLTIIYFYVVDEENRLMGVVPTRKLLLCDPEVKICDILESSVIKLKENESLQEALQSFSTYNLLALPVVSEDNRLLGVVDVDMYMEESLDIADTRRRADIFQLIGLSLEEERSSSILMNYRLRMPWILCSMFGGIICAIISRIHEAVLSKMLVLAMFIPLVLTLSESVSMQSMTHALQYIKTPRFSLFECFKRAFKEWRVVALVALTSGGIVGGLSLFWKDGGMVSFVIGIGIVLSVIISSSFGILFPILLHKTRLDPKVASGPVVLMLADVLTTVLYLSLASYILL